MKIEKVTYQEPIIQRSPLGKKPANTFSDSPQVVRDYVEIHQAPPEAGSVVWGDVPLKNDDGTPQMRSLTVALDLTPRSPWKYGLVAAGIGAAVGALSGWVGATALGLSDGLAALSGAAALGTLAGGGAALAVRGDQVKVVWTTHEIRDPQLLGYHQFVGAGELNGQKGYFHRYVPHVQEKVIGSYRVPAAKHYKNQETGS